VSPRITEAACALTQTNTAFFTPHGTPQATRTTLPKKGTHVSDSKSFFFQPASRVMQEESPIKKMVSVANTCDYLIVKPATRRTIFLIVGTAYHIFLVIARGQDSTKGK